jgi:hypothetical protein
MQFHEVDARRSVRCVGGSFADWISYNDSSEDCAAFDRHVAEGLVAYRTAGWAACLAEYDLPCDATLNPCRYEILHGLVPDGQSCQDFEVCGTVSACFNAGGAVCGEVCARFAVENEPCGLYCGGTTPCLDATACGVDLSCVGGVCVKAGHAGQACGGAQLPACGLFLFCSADPADPQSIGTCMPRASGGVCRCDGECPVAEFCLAGTCTARRPVGSSCADAPSGCIPWTICDASTNVCAAAGRTDQPCAPFPGIPDFLTCTTGTCDGTSCVATSGPGQSCATASCATGTSCDPTTVMCVACPAALPSL